jgi:hypothetical protein
MEMPTPCDLCGDICEFNDMRECEICKLWACRVCQSVDDRTVCEGCIGDNNIILVDQIKDLLES